MSHRLTVSVIGALAAASLMAPVAHAGTPAKVGVRVEAPGKTLADATLTTTRAKVVGKDGDATHSCSGTSAAGALEQATGGKWTASWFDGLGYAVDSIGGVKPASFSEYWTLWLNGKSSTTGVCDTELQAGDQVLEFLCKATPDFSSCTNLPLELRPGRIHLRGTDYVLNVHVVRLAGDGTSTPVAGATVHGGLQPVITGAGGSASVKLPRQALLRATHAGDVPSGTVGCVTADGGGSCGSGDRQPPLVRVQGIRPGQSFALADAPRELDGIARDPSGVTVALRLTRRVDGRCASFAPGRGTFRPCGKQPRTPFDVGDRTHWSYLLPKPLLPGKYVLLVRGTDAAGNVTREWVRFTVESV